MAEALHSLDGGRGLCLLNTIMTITSNRTPRTLHAVATTMTRVRVLMWFVSVSSFDDLSVVSITPPERKTLDYLWT